MRFSNPSHIIKSWLPIALLATLFSLLVYGTVQQDMRQGANDPQIEIAEDAATALAAGAKYQTNLPQEVAIGQSLAPYAIIYDDKSVPVSGTGKLHNTLPTPPAGVFAFARAHGENRLTWQPEPTIREAIVVKYFTGTRSGFVLAGRSLRETEIRVAQLSRNVLIGWLVTLVVMLGVIAFVTSKKPEVSL